MEGGRCQIRRPKPRADLQGAGREIESAKSALPAGLHPSAMVKKGRCDLQRDDKARILLNAPRCPAIRRPFFLPDVRGSILLFPHLRSPHRRFLPLEANIEKKGASRIQ